MAARDAGPRHVASVARADRDALRDPRVALADDIVGPHDADEQRERLVAGLLLLCLFGGSVHVIYRWPDVLYASRFLRHDDRDRITRAAAGTASGAEVRRGHRALAGD